MLKRLFESKTLATGVRLISVPMQSTETVTVLVMVKTGSRYETKEQNGISHFLEHLMFKGTTNRPTALDIATELDSLGAEYNAFTGKEYTGYYAKCAAEKFSVALDCIADIFQNSLFAPGEINKERGAIKEEINMYFDTPSRYVNNLYEKLAYGDQPLGWDIAGPKENIERLAREQIAAYFESHYVAGRTVIAVTGNVSAEEALGQVTKKFAGVREGAKTSASPYIESQSRPGFKYFNKATDQTHLNLGFKCHPENHPSYHAEELLATILGGGMSSRLFTEVREKRGLAYRIGAGVSSYHETADLTTHAGVTNDKVLEAVRVILQEYRRLGQEAVPEAELSKAKDYLKGRFAIGLEQSDAQAVYYAEQELLKGKIETPEEYLAKISAVASADIQKVAQEIFVPERLNLALIGPAGTETGLAEIIGS